jgi:pyruvate dehydrogenase (quinone)
MAKRVADVVVETLQAAGVKRCWGVPGDTLHFVADAIRLRRYRYSNPEIDLRGEMS